MQALILKYIRFVVHGHLRIEIDFFTGCGYSGVQQMHICCVKPCIHICLHGCMTHFIFAMTDCAT